MEANNDLEVWKDVKGYKGYYQISNFGRLKSLNRKVNSWCGGRTVNERIRIPAKTIWGYFVFRLSKKRKIVHMSIHRLIAIHFINNPENKREVNHINGIKADNRIENLEWVTSSENKIHSYKLGLQIPKRGEDNYSAVLSDEDVIKIKEALRDKVKSQYRLAKDFGVHKMTVNDIYQNKTWKHIKI